EYFQLVSAVAALGTRKGDHVEIVLSINDKGGRQRTEKAFNLLGLKLNRSKHGVRVESAEGKSQAKKQDTVAALAIDDQGMQEAFAAGKPYVLDIPVERVPVFPAASLWKAAFYPHERYPGGLAEALTADPRMARLYLALNSMDRAAAEVLLQAVPLATLAESYAAELSFYSAALAMNGSVAEVPGGEAAEAVWRELAGVSPRTPAAFFQKLLSRDDGRLMAFFYTLSELDVAHQRFFTRSAERTKKFYELYRESPEMHRGGERRLSASAFVEFLRDVPLKVDGTVDFPGGPEVWMIAKGHTESVVSLAKMTQKLARTATPEDEDAVVIRLANTAYKAQRGEGSELANFIAVARINAQRAAPLTADAALLLAQKLFEVWRAVPVFRGAGKSGNSRFSTRLSSSSRVRRNGWGYCEHSSWRAS
ncbi:MAG: hypothetical protein JO097_16575, partial [Acidobacteriaceae bacterium]|nr:hypothetical protein [Acidobacteriaceae bacterium]